MTGSDAIHTDAILESISDGVFTVDLHWRITSFNRAAEEITGIPREEALGRPCSEVLRASLCEQGCPLRRTLSTGQPVIDQSAFVVDAEGQRIPISISTAVLRDASGELVGGAETFRDLSLVEELRKQLHGRYRVGDLVSCSPAMREVFEILPAVADSDSTVLIQGETGTGKELLAQALHGLGPRKDRPFVAVNCGAFPDSLLESELFGHRSGAFTGATRDRQGRFARAEGGTLFLDELGEMSPAMQVKLLRVIQERVYEPLGSSRSIHTDVRILCATNRDLAERVRAGAFREDLYYRIHVVQIDLPPLRERLEDVPLLVEHFVTRFNRLRQRDLAGVDTRAMALLMAHDWPGNVRELENAIEHAYILCREGWIQPQHLPRELLALRPRGGSRALADIVQAAETQAILEPVRRHDGNREAAARELGVHKSTLFRKVSELGISLPPGDGRSRR